MPKILVLDDELEISKILEKFLRNNGFEVIATNEASKALEIVNSQQKLDLMILDIKMPKMNGIEFLQELDKNKIQIPAVILSGSMGGQENIDALKQLGYDEEEILYKPIDLTELLVKVKQKLSFQP